MEEKDKNMLVAAIKHIFKNIKFSHENSAQLVYMYCFVYLMKWHNLDFTVADNIIKEAKSTNSGVTNNCVHFLYGLNAVSMKNHGKGAREQFKEDVKTGYLPTRISEQWFKDNRNRDSSQPPDIEDVRVFREIMKSPPNFIELKSKSFPKPTILRLKKQAILYGPPGTGKTYRTKEIAVDWLLED